MTQPREYTCAHCGGTFTTDVPLEDVYAEEQKVFGFHAVKTRESLCDTCYQDFRAWLDVLTPEKRAELDRQARLDEASSEEPQDCAIPEDL